MKIGTDEERGATVKDAIREFVVPGPLKADAVNASVRIKAFVAPYGVVNSYGESFEPGAFDEFVARLEDLGNTTGGYKLPLNLMHEDHAIVGAWTRLYTTPEGLWAEGYLDKELLGAVKEYGLNEVSISWLDPSQAGNPYAPTTFIRYAQAKHDGMYVAEHAKLSRTIHKSEGVALDHIALVDRGAFSGTHWEVIR